MEELRQSMHTKSWIFHIVVSLSRVIYPAFGVAYWQKAYSHDHDESMMNLEFIKLTEPIIKITTITLIALGLLLDILIWRRRKYAAWLLYFELLNVLLQGLVPFNYGHFTLTILCMTFVMIYVLVGCNMGPNIIATILTLTVVVFVEIPLLHREEWDGIMVTGKFFTVLVCFLFLTGASMLFTYGAQIRSRMTQLIIENLSLLDKMHEGLIVITESDRKLKFASTPAVRLLK